MTANGQNGHTPSAWNAAIIVMGVSGAGKSTIAQRLAARLNRVLIEGDSLHPPQNVAKMKQGIPLADEDRLPWLQAIAAQIETARRANKPVVVTCSALKRTYRATLCSGNGDVGFIYLKGARELIAQRLAARKNHFMPAQLLESQFDALQEPAEDEPSIMMTIEPQPDEIVERIVAMVAPKPGLSSGGNRG